jgi:phosphohistidine phosphatase
MPKQLFIIRHAKSDWDNPRLADFDRPLNKRGHRDAPAMAKKLLKRHVIPQHLVSSPANRAITTAEYFADTLQLDKKRIQQEKNIYEASSSRLLEVINKLDNHYDVIAIFGHNPGVSNLTINLCNKHIELPTCGIAFIKFPFDDWKMISNGTGELGFFDYPKNTD